MLRKLFLAVLTMSLAGVASAAGGADLLSTWRAEARAHDASFVDFSAARGESLYVARVTDWSCSTCHSSNPQSMGRHAVTHKSIQPLSPLANPKRFTDAAKTEKWFRRNCKDVLKRECTPVEKGDFLSYLMSQSKQVPR